MIGGRGAPNAVLLVRHAQTKWTDLGRYQGRRDVPLSSAGERAAHALAHELASRGARAVWSSPLCRARATAEAIARRADLGVVVLPSLTELDFGEWEGLTQPAIKQRWPEALRQWKRGEDDARPPAGESLGEARARLRAALCELYRTEEGTVVVVTHTILIRLALTDGHGGRLERFEIPPCSVHPLSPRETPSVAGIG